MIKVNKNLFWIFLAIIYYLIPITVQYIRSIGITIIFLLFSLSNLDSIKAKCQTIIAYGLGWIGIYFLLSLYLNYSLQSIFQEILSIILCLFPTILFLIIDDYNLSYQNYLKKAIIIAVIIGSLNTFIVLDIFPNASRLLATGKSENSIYARMGAGGYGFIYSLVFIIPVFIRESFRSKGIYRVFLFAVAMVLSFVVVKASYTIAVLLMIVMIAYSFCTKKWQKTFLTLMGIGCVLFIDDSVLANVLYKVSSWFEAGSTLNLKFIQLAKGYIENDIHLSTGGRIELYDNTLKVIKNSPILGALKTGHLGEGHTSWLDLYAKYGVFSLLFFLLIRSQQKHTTSKLKEHSFLTFLLFAWVVLGFINPIHNQSPVAFAIFFVAPLFERDANEKCLE